jgi:hypothetical protein
LDIERLCCRGAPACPLADRILRRRKQKM